MKAITKRLIDIVVSLTAMLTLLPVLLLIGILVAIAMGRPIVFAQRRPGMHAKVFQIYKFRTMNDLRDSNGYPLPDQDRITPIGRLMRITSLDELPQLFNVLKGEMSLVGPRPILAHYAADCRPEHLVRYTIRPGMTGWAQIQGRRALDYEKRFEYDLWYAEHQSVLLDVRIMMLTVLQIFKQEGTAEIDQPVSSCSFAGNITPPDQASKLPKDDDNREVITEMLYEQILSNRYGTMIAEKNLTKSTISRSSNKSTINKPPARQIHV